MQDVFAGGKAAAIKAGYTHYFNKPCKHGHTSPRPVTSGNCPDCLAIKNAARPVSRRNGVRKSPAEKREQKRLEKEAYKAEKEKERLFKDAHVRCSSGHMEFPKDPANGKVCITYRVGDLTTYCSMKAIDAYYDKDRAEGRADITYSDGSSTHRRTQVGRTSCSYSEDNGYVCVACLKDEDPMSLSILYDKSDSRAYRPSRRWKR